MIPRELLGAVSHPSAGQIAIVIGAGCSVEPPTSLPLARECAREAHRRLVQDRFLDDGECPNPEDLSGIADTIYLKYATQSELVRRLPLTRFQNAGPNEGHLIAAALLREHAISIILTLNFDLAMSHALSQMGAQDDVVIVSRPEEHGQLGIINLVYLHRNVSESNGDCWILRTEQLEEAWRDAWEELITMRVATTPHLVFAGLGSPAAVLVETTRKIKQALSESVKVFQVDPNPMDDSEFAGHLGIEQDSFIQLPWTEFMVNLGNRLAAEHLEHLARACEQLIRENNLEQENFREVLDEMNGRGLLWLGLIRANWMLQHAKYLPARGFAWELFADLLLCIAMIQRVTNAEVLFDNDASILLRRNGRDLCRITPISGRGTRRFTAVEPRMHQISENIQRAKGASLHIFLLAAIQGSVQPEISAPEDIIHESEESDIIVGQPSSLVLDVEELRQNPNQINEVLGSGQ